MWLDGRAFVWLERCCIQRPTFLSAYIPWFCRTAASCSPVAESEPFGIAFLLAVTRILRNPRSRALLGHVFCCCSSWKQGEQKVAETKIRISCLTKSERFSFLGLAFPWGSPKHQDVTSNFSPKTSPLCWKSAILSMMLPLRLELLWWWWFGDFPDVSHYPQSGVSVFTHPPCLHISCWSTRATSVSLSSRLPHPTRHARNLCKSFSLCSVGLRCALRGLRPCAVTSNISESCIHRALQHFTASSVSRLLLVPTVRGSWGWSCNFLLVVQSSSHHLLRSLCKKHVNSPATRLCYTRPGYSCPANCLGLYIFQMMSFLPTNVSTLHDALLKASWAYFDAAA